MKRSIKDAIKEAAVTITGMPEEVILDLPVLRLIGNEKIEIENFYSIQSYNDDLIKIKTSCGVLSVAGRNLTIVDLDIGKIRIRGTVLSVCYA